MEDEIQINEELKKKDGQWVLISRKTGRILRKYGAEKPTKARVAKDEQEIEFFKKRWHKKL